MINPEYKKEIKVVLGGFYSPKIISFLKKKNVLNSDGNFFSNDSIQKIVSGKQSNPEVEFLIIKLVEKTKKQNQLLNQLQLKKTN